MNRDPDHVSTKVFYGHLTYQKWSYYCTKIENYKQSNKRRPKEINRRKKLRIEIRSILYSFIVKEYRVPTLVLGTTVSSFLPWTTTSSTTTEILWDDQLMILYVVEVHLGSVYIKLLLNINVISGNNFNWLVIRSGTDSDEIKLLNKGKKSIRSLQGHISTSRRKTYIVKNILTLKTDLQEVKYDPVGSGTTYTSPILVTPHEYQLRRTSESSKGFIILVTLHKRFN